MQENFMVVHEFGTIAAFEVKKSVPFLSVDFSCISVISIFSHPDIR